MKLWHVLYLAVFWTVGLWLLRFVTRNSVNEGVRAVAIPFTYVTMFTAAWGTFISLFFAMSRDPRHAEAVSFVLLAAPIMTALAFICEFLGLFHRTVQLEELVLPTQLPAHKHVTIAHLSDLHISYGASLGKGCASEDLLFRAEAAIRWRLERADLVVLTGDLADRGGKEEWELFKNLINAFSSEERAGILIVPGNHDLSLTTSYSMLEGAQQSIDHEHRCQRFVESSFSNAPTDWRVCDATRTPVIDILKSADAYRKIYALHPPKAVIAGRHLSFGTPVQLLEAARACTSPHCWPNKSGYLYRDLLNNLYPMLFWTDDDNVLIGLNSANTSGGSMWSSAFGRLGGRQLRKLQSILQEFPDKRLILLLHHHVGCPPLVRSRFAARRPWLATKFLQLCDARSLHTILRQWGGKYLILHGHKHVSYRARMGNGTILSAASVGCGDSLGGKGPTGAVYAVSAHDVSVVDELHI